MSNQASGGDPRRSMALLWGRHPSPSRGPRPGLDVPTIVRAAITLADSDGLEGLSLRKIADELGCSAMTIYTYVHGKAELLDLMLDAVLGEIDVAPKKGSWRSREEAFARDLAAHYERHSWVLQVSYARALLGPNELAVYEAHLR